MGYQHGKHLQVAQLGRPGQQVGDKQHAQPVISGPAAAPGTCAHTRNRPGPGRTSEYEPVRASSRRSTFPG